MSKRTFHVHVHTTLPKPHNVYVYTNVIDYYVTKTHLEIVIKYMGREEVHRHAVNTIDHVKVKPHDTKTL